MQVMYFCRLCTYAKVLKVVLVKESLEAKVSLRVSVNFCVCFVVFVFLDLEGKKDVTERKQRRERSGRRRN